MAVNKLKEFYKYVALGEFDKALEMAEEVKTFGTEKEKIVIQCLELKKKLQNSGCLNNV
jgi:hypothetical protein